MIYGAFVNTPTPEFYIEMAKTLQGRLNRARTRCCAPFEAGLKLVVVLRFHAMKVQAAVWLLILGCGGPVSLR